MDSFWQNLFVMKKMENKKSFEIIFDKDASGPFIKIKSHSKGSHYAIHRNYIKRNQLGLEENLRISDEIKDLLINSLNVKGITEGFILHTDEYDNFIPLENQNEKVDPKLIRHKLSSKETNFTSTGEKLNYHWPVFKKLQETGFGSIIRATLTLHQVCASKCQFCSTINRNRQDSISLEEAKSFVKKLYFEQADFNRKNFSKYNEEYKKISGSDIRLKSIILSGGGQPNLWPHFTELVNWLSELDLDLGLITNGFPKNVPDDIYNKFKWVRLSITPEDASPFYPEKRFDLQRIPKCLIDNKNTTFGLSYVYGPWTSVGILERINQAINDWNLDYVRFLTDCNLGRNEQLRAHKVLAEKLHKLGLVDEEGNSIGKIFHQLKYHGNQSEANELWDQGKCFLQTYNVFWDTTGHEENGESYCYPCDSVTVLAEDTSNVQAAREFDGNKWGTVKNTQVEKLFNEQWKAFFDPRKNCSACLFMKNNHTVKQLLNLKTENFESIDLSNKPMHINFP
jgi:hypothetical protein